MSAKFILNDLWKFGPDWLHREESTWPTIEIPLSNKFPGFKKKFCLNTLPNSELFNSSMPQSQQHPMVLPRSSHIPGLIILNEHLENKHAGIQTTLYAIRRRFWPLDGRSQVRKIIRKCIRCIRVNPSTAEYLMGNFPSIRITQARPFSNVGVDYCGPFYIKEKKICNRSRVKVCVPIFICLVAKAVHLEVVSDMTTEGFLAALRRFTARRGRPNIHNERASHVLSDQGVKWRFIPPLSPHFGAIWEATVKVFKHHFKRVIGDVLFTFEELNMFTIEVEAILNSHPFTPISRDPNDMLALTPGHFIIGDSLTNLPQVDLTSA
ncbi:uncharacterized protein LOC117175309 [Belonocnema kinseyi]|uniref:uncharacterized protein LOC117175309 n=1 Tax=Belonocnema kinseyi TaxID=2817044 RepID=UPI00143DF2D3|nr:uncharacterized protein LOC117175309 [Belonocnema kinseyi]